MSAHELVIEKFDLSGEPVANVLWVPIEQVEANDYNPNRVAANELRLLYHSIRHDGYTQPVVTIYDEPRDLYVIVDGFHRWLVMKRHSDIRERTGGRLPIVVIDKPIAERMASTIRHNRARGKHSVAGMSQVVFAMLDEGVSDERICAELGLEVDELLRLKHITGFARLFKDAEYGQAWETRRMIQLRKEYEARDGN
jgi:ParB-like chromosome segregation protein Spo0J